MFVCIMFVKQNIRVSVQFESLLREIFIKIHMHTYMPNVFVYTS